MHTRWKYFSEDELRCQGTGEIHMDEKFMSKLDELRDKLKQPMTISSGYRSESHYLNKILVEEGYDPEKERDEFINQYSKYSNMSDEELDKPFIVVTANILVDGLLSTCISLVFNSLIKVEPHLSNKIYSCLNSSLSCI